MSQKNSGIYIIIPAFNEAVIIQDVIAEIQKAGYQNIIIVDDGSTDNTYKKSSEMAEVIALKHFLNRGKGAAVKTGMEAAKMLGVEIAVTIDGDGQHNPEENDYSH